jgi:hypothetical protein
MPGCATPPAVGSGIERVGGRSLGLLETGRLGSRRRACTRRQHSGPSCPSEATHPKAPSVPRCAGEMPLASTGVRRHVRVLGSTTARSRDTAWRTRGAGVAFGPVTRPTASGLGWRDGVGDEFEDAARIRWLAYAARANDPAADPRGVRVQVPPPTPDDQGKSPGH